MQQKINETKDYGIFRTIEGNRVINQRNLAGLTVSIMQQNLLSANPIIVNENMEVVDGQHRLEVAKANNLPIYYVIVPQASIDHVIFLNKYKKQWELKDYIKSYSTRGYEDYQWIEKYMEEFSLSPSVAMAFLTGSDSGSQLSIIKSGKLQLSDEMRERAEEVANVYMEIRAYIRRSGFIPRAFARAVFEMVEEGQGKKTIDGLRKHGKMFMPESTIRGARKQLEDLAK